MKNLAWAIGGLIVLLIGVFLFTSKTKHTDDTIIPTPVSLVSPTPDLESLNKVDTQAENKKMQVPFEILTKEQIQGKKIKIETNKGDIVFELLSDSPIASSNFIYLVNKKFYNGLIFHRVVKGFMIQGGDPSGNGSGGPGYAFQEKGIANGGKYQRGIVAMAKTAYDPPGTGGSQFFIMQDDKPLPPDYAIFGNVVAGMDVVDKIAETEGQNESPTEKITMKSVTVQ